MDVRPIRDDTDHEWALGEIRRLWGAAAGTPEAERLEVLGVLVDAYEEGHHAVPPADPIEAILFRLEARGLRPDDLRPCIGGKGRVSEILNRRRRLTLPMIRRLSAALDLPIEVLAREYPIEPRRQAS